MSVGIYFSGLYVKIYKIKSGFGQRVGTYVRLGTCKTGLSPPVTLCY